MIIIYKNKGIFINNKEYINRFLIRFNKVKNILIYYRNKESNNINFNTYYNIYNYIYNKLIFNITFIINYKV